ncbi:MAG: signal peptidase I [Bacteroidetes bacterium]|jgi:signal peptidase I|nr:signal peptidase I [Bacteroidota bacterium]
MPRFPPDPPADSRLPARATFAGVLRLVGIALLVALLIRLLVIEGFRIPTASMEQSLLPGDLVLVSKVHYGPRLPRTIPVPLTDRTLPGFADGPAHLPGFTTIQRGDVVVFTRPLHAGAVGARRYYIKRVVGLPGDTVQVRGGLAYVNGERLPAPDGLQRQWAARVERTTVLPTDTLRALGATQVGRPDSLTRVFEGTDALAARVRARPGVVRVTARHREHPAVYVPARGDTLRGAMLEEAPYRDLWRRFETVSATVQPAAPDEWVVRENQYYVLGDNRGSSIDSRIWGFVAARDVVGKAVLVYASWDPASDGPRWERWLTPVP